MAIVRGRRMEKEVEVLLEFEGNRTILHSQPSQLLGKVETELCGFGDKSKQKVYTLSDVPKEPQHFLLQRCIYYSYSYNICMNSIPCMMCRWSKKYEAFINAKEIDEIKDYDKISVVQNAQLGSVSSLKVRT